MSCEVKVEVNSIQDEGEDKNEIKMKTDGHLYNKQGIYYLKYEEELEGLEDVKTTLKIKEDSLTLIRQGKVRMKQDFILNKRTEFDYKTPYGDLKLEIEVDNLEIDVDSTSGEIKIDYRLFNEAGLISSNYLNICYEEE